MYPVTPPQVVNVVDLGYLGVEKDFPEQLSALPYKKKRNQFLSDDEKEYNKIHSKKRIIVEHTISRLKKYRIMSDIFRNKLRKYNKVSDIVAGLINYRISNQQKIILIMLIMQEILVFSVIKRTFEKYDYLIRLKNMIEEMMLKASLYNKFASF